MTAASRAGEPADPVAAPGDLPLHGIRVLDLTDGPAESCGRYLADLGAEVVKIEPPGGAVSRTEQPVVDRVSIPFALRNANKLGAVLDLDSAAGRDRLRELCAGADLLLESGPPGMLAERGLGPEQLLATSPELVYLSLTDFGATGPYRDWVATDPVLCALGGVLSRSGLPGAPPLLPPEGLAEHVGAAFAAWAALVAFTKRLATGVGEHVDVSAHEAVVHGFDPGFGTQGSAAAGRADTYPRDRPDARMFYPVFGCRDGLVRICVLARRQWRAMFGWLGEPAEFADPRFDSIGARFAAADTLHPLIEGLFAGHTRAELVTEGSRRGVPVAGVLEPAEVLTAEHFARAGALADVELAPGLTARAPTGYVTVNGRRAGLRHRAPRLDEHGAELDPRRPADAHPSVPGPAGSGAAGSGAAGSGAAGSARVGRGRPGAGEVDPAAGPLAGLRVLDLGVIVFGAELGRLFADQGADVIKIENSAFPDGLRQSRGGHGFASSFAWGHRNERGLGLDLRSPEGAEVFRSLAARADVVLANFKPGTLEGLGFSHRDLVELNPGLVVCDSSAFGPVGPWSNRLGYGPLVRSSCGVSTLWRYPDTAATGAGPGGAGTDGSGTDGAGAGGAGFCDGSTVYPDHVAGHLAAVAVLAALIGRARTGVGAAVGMAQADVALVQLGEQFVAESLAPGTARAVGNSPAHRAPSGVFGCAGDDEWCVVDVRDDADWARLCGVLERPDLLGSHRWASVAGRLADRAEVEAVVAAWTAARAPREAMTALQEAGVPAGAMLRLPDELSDPQLRARGAFGVLRQPQLTVELPANSGVARFSTIADPPNGPAPEAGEHTGQICREVLGLTDERITELAAAGILQLPPQ